jgi:heptosyltransferase I
MEIGQAIVAGAEGHAQLAPKTTLPELAALSRRAKMFIGSDTGPLHLAAAVGTPCVGLYGPWPATTNGPYGSAHLAVQKMTLEGSTHERRHASPRYMEAIDVDSVCEACDQILRRESWSAA